jgi:hypothetical protein
MIISASRRTDIPALYSEWFLNRLKAGFVMVPNPRVPNRIGRVELSPDNVDCIVFWTKNPIPMLNKLNRIEAMGYAFYFQFTLTPYGKTIERNLPPKTELIDAFAELGQRIGSERLVWRYDPILIDPVHSIQWHHKCFYDLCDKLHPYTRRCVLSFIDPYKHIAGHFQEVRYEEIIAVASRFSKIAKEYDLALFACAEEIDFTEYGISRSSCIDSELIEQILGCGIRAKKDTAQRTACACIESVDIGVYDTCTNECAYCYATTSPSVAIRHFQNHVSDAPMLTGFPIGGEIITDRTKK